MSWELYIGLAALVCAIAALLLAGSVWLTQRARRRAENQDDPEPTVVPPRRVAFVVNPSKAQADGLRAMVREEFDAAGLPEPTWLETTVEDPGVGQARKALADRADVVVAAGGDGTVRAVAEALVGTGQTMAIIPIGTGNLLARNLDLPVGDPRSAVRVVITGSDRPIDVGRLRILEYADDDLDPGPFEDAPAGSARAPADAEHLFLVIAGLGFDAAMVADADDALKAKVGWLAYFVAGVGHLHGRRMRARIALDGGKSEEVRVRTLMIGNCGRLPGGITLLPDAVIDDGILDIAAVDTRVGLAGWTQLLGEVVLQGFGLRANLPAKIGRIDHVSARRVRARVDGGEQAQLDGEPLGKVVELEAWADPGALVVRTGVPVAPLGDASP